MAYLDEFRKKRVEPHTRTWEGPVQLSLVDSDRANPTPNRTLLLTMTLVAT